MATVIFVGNAINTAQVDTLQVTAVAVGGTLSATINGKSVTYTCVTGDTVSTAATAWQALLSAQTAPAEFGEVTWTVATDTVTGTATTPGTPFTLTKSQAGGATCTLTHLTANSSQSDVGIAANWLRAGVVGLPQNADDVVLQNCTVGLLYNLTALAAIQFATLTRYQSHSGQVGLPVVNPNGYLEYRPTRFQFTGSGTLTAVLGVADSGDGPPLERYDAQAQKTALTVLNSGSPSGAYAVEWLTTENTSTVTVLNTTVGFGANVGETAALASATVDGGGSLTLGSGVTMTGALNVKGGSATISCAPGSVVVSEGGSLTVMLGGLTIATLTASGGSALTYLAGGTITTLTLQTGSTLDKSGSAAALTITNSTIDGDTCQVIDPLNSITFTNATTVNQQVQQGPFLVGGGRTWKLT